MSDAPHVLFAEQIDNLRKLVAAGQHEVAVSHADEILNKERAASLLLVYGEALQNLSRYEEAAAAYAEAALSATHRPDALAGQALALCNLKRYQEALELCQEALELAPDCVEALRGKAHALLRLQQVNEAYEVAARALELAPQWPLAHVTMGLVRMLQMHAPDAEKHFRKALELDADCAPAYTNLGFMLRRMNRLDEAVASLQEAVRLRPKDHGSLNTLALACIDLNRHNEAQHYLEQALELAPNNEGYLLNLAALLRNLGRLDEAVALSRRVLETNPDNLQAMTNVSSLLLQAGNTREALEAAQLMVQRVPDAAVGHYNLAVALLHVRRPFDGEAEALKALELGMDAPALHLALAQSRQMLQRYDGALEASERALALREDSKSHFSKAMALKGLGRVDEAVYHFRKSVEFDPSDAQGASAFIASLLGSDAGTGLSEAYLRRLFNQYAGTYDSHLTQALKYRGPALLGQALEGHLAGREGLRILDLGCGTGLCAPVLQQWARELVGVDISENMVRKARDLGLYHRLEWAEACAFLEAETEPYDCVAAGDVLVYIGELSRVFAGVAGVLTQGGVFVFTLEKQDAPGYSLGHKNRFRHSRDYVEQLAQAHGFACLELREDSVRSEEHTPVASWVGVLRRE